MSLLSNFYPQANAVLTSGNQNISGIKNFDSRPTVRGTGVLLQGEAAGGPVILPSNILFTTGNQVIRGEKTFVEKIIVQNEKFNQEVSRWPAFSLAGGIPKFWSGWQPNTWYIELEPSSFITVISTGAGSQLFADWYATTGVPVPVQGSPIVPNSVKFNLLAKGTNLPENGVLTGQFSAVGAGFNFTGTGFLPPNTRYLHFLNPIDGGGNMFLRVIGEIPVVKKYDITIQNDRLFINNSGVLFQGDKVLFQGDKVNFTQRPTLSGLNLITTGDLVDLELNIEGALASSSAFNGNRQIRQIPIINTNYGGTTISGFLNNLFFPYTQVSITLDNFALRSYGYDESLTATFIGNITPTDDIITGIRYMHGTTGLFGPESRTTDGGYNRTVNLAPAFPTAFDRTSLNEFRARILGTRSGIGFTGDSNPQRLRFEPPYFVGISTLPSLLQSNITGSLTRVDPSTYFVSPNNYSVGGRPSNFVHSFTFDNSRPNGYIYIVYPNFQNPTDSLNNWGELLTNGGIVDTNNLQDYSSQYIDNRTSITLNLPRKSNLNYRIYRSDLITPINLPTTFTLRFTFGG